MLLTHLYKFFKRLFGRAFFVIFAILLQIVWVVLFFLLLGYRYPLFEGAVSAISVVVVLAIMNRKMNPAYKQTWTLLILALPLVGLAIYLLLGRPRLSRKTKHHFEEFSDYSSRLLTQEDDIQEALREKDGRIERQSHYIAEAAKFPVYQGTQTKYYPFGELLFQDMVKELNKARHFIFLEYFIIDDGEMWGTILDILEKKAREGLDVRLIYDDVGCVNTLPAKFYKELRRRGIKCEVFNRFRPVVSIFLNNRDHRKIMVIDGCVGFTGGINLADEYINKKQRFGRWKDTGVMLKGAAVWNFTVMFLDMWSAITGTTEDLSADATELYRPECYHEETFPDDGFVQPYGDTPLDSETVGENVYLNIISNAKRYVYIFTPYLIIDNEMMTCLCLAARSGVDVRIVTPGVPDKKMVFLLTRSYYEQLIDAGVRIYEYKPGFLHAKCFVCDDEVGTVGTINLDYRSLYMHFECGVWMYGSRAVMQIKEDMAATMAESEEFTKEDCRKLGPVKRIFRNFFRLLAPVL